MTDDDLDRVMDQERPDRTLARRLQTFVIGHTFITWVRFAISRAYRGCRSRFSGDCGEAVSFSPSGNNLMTESPGPYDAPTPRRFYIHDDISEAVSEIFGADSIVADKVTELFGLMEDRDPDVSVY